MVTKPKSKGGLGVINLWRQNEVLLLKHLHTFYNKDDLPWVNLIWANYYRNGSTPGQIRRGSFWWESIVKLLDMFKGISQAEAGIGETILFWKTCGMEESYISHTHTSILLLLIKKLNCQRC
jgi:hypothetical protein